jgi:EIN3-binding F-box protein
MDLSGDDEIYSGGSLYANSSDLGRLYSIGSRVDVYSPACKRARISAPFLFGSSGFEQNKRPSIEVLPDECLFEIFRRVPEGKERSSCACVSKKWLMLLSSIRRNEFCSSSAAAEEKETVAPVRNDVEMVSCEENREVESDGYLTRSLEGKKATDMRLAAIADKQPRGARQAFDPGKQFCSWGY